MESNEEWEYHRLKYSQADLHDELEKQARKFRVNRVIQIKKDTDLALQIVHISLDEEGVIVYVK